MNGSFHRIKKYFLYTCTTVVLLVVTAATVVYFNQDAIIALFVQELNKNLRTKVEVGKIELSLFEKFPQVALEFKQLTLHGALDEVKQPLAKADHLYLTFDFWNIFGGKYVVNQVFLEDANVQIFVDKRGDENYQIFKVDSNATSSGQQIDFDLEKIKLDKVNVVYTDQKNDQEHALYAQKVDASLKMRGDDLFIALQGDVQSRYIRIDNFQYFADKPLAIESELIYNLDSRNLTIKPSSIGIKKSEFLVAGTFENHSSGKIDLKINGKNADIQTLVSLLPPQYVDQLSIYRSKGKVYFDSQVKGATFKGVTPTIQVQFGCENASFYHAEANKTIESAYLKGSFDNGSRQKRSTSTLTLTNIRGKLDGRPFSGNFSMQNFDNPYLSFAINGELDAGSLLAFYPLKQIKKAAGILDMDVAFEGKLTDLRSRASNRFVHTSGQINLKNLSLSLPEKDWAFTGINGNFHFNKSDLSIDNLTGQAGRSDFKLGGSFKNVMPYLFFSDQDLRIEASFTSQLIDFDELLAATGASPNSQFSTVADPREEKYEFLVSPRLSCDLQCSVAQVKFRRFIARNIKGNLLLNRQIASSPDIQLETANGNIQVNGTVNARQPDRVEVNCLANFNKLAIDSVFYMFENFDQTFIRDKHLRGNATATVQTFMVFDRHLNMDVPSLVADAQVNIVNGGLIHFEPMQKLSKFINRNELANMQFAQLQNNIHIENRTVFLPEMNIRSNVAHISVKGTHTFDQVMDYQLRIPVNTFIGRRTRTALDAGVESEEVSNLFLRIKGTSDDYQIAYDKEAANAKMKQDWKEEKRELKDLFKGKNKREDRATKEDKKTTTPPEAEEEFFDF